MAEIDYTPWADRRIIELEAENERLSETIRALHDQLRPLVEERSRLQSEAARLRWPDGPFTLHWWRYFSPQSENYDTPLEAVRCADGIEDTGEGSIERVTDRNGVEIYDLRSYPYKRVADGYPEIPDDL